MRAFGLSGFGFGTTTNNNRLTSGGGPFPGPDIISGAGSFASATGWTLTGGATISGGRLNLNGSGNGKALRTASITGVPGTYRCTFDVISTDGGDVVRITCGNSPVGTAVPGSTVPGSYSIDIVTTFANQNVSIQGDSFVCVLDNFVVKQIA